MTTPQRPSRRSGRLALIAVAGVALGGAFALRGKKRAPVIGAAPPRPDPETRPVPAPLADTPDPVALAREPAPAPEPAPGRLGAEWKLVRMAVGAGVVVVLAIVAAVVTEPTSGDGTVTPPLVVTRSPGLNGMYTYVTVPGPVGRDERVALAGTDGSRVEVGTKVDIDRVSYDNANERTVFFKVHLKNTGAVPVIARLDPDAWVLDSGDTNYQAGSMRSQMVETRVAGAPPSLEPGWEVDLTLGFDVALNAELVRLHVTLPMPGKPAAEWNLR